MSAFARVGGSADIDQRRRFMNADYHRAKFVKASIFGRIRRTLALCIVLQLRPKI
jgi:hypothetical protein